MPTRDIYDSHSVPPKEHLTKANILVVCEGEKTEPHYFDAFDTNGGDCGGGYAVKVTTVGTATNTLQVVDKALELREAKYDSVWSVFDKDNFDKFNDAIIKAYDNHIGCAWSNEAFELWFLYHFVNRTTGMSRKQYQREISEYVRKSGKYKSKKPYKYEKNDKRNRKIMEECGSRSNAIKWAEAQSGRFTDGKVATHNPCTMVFKLVRQLIGKDTAFNEQIKEKINIPPEAQLERQNKPYPRNRQTTTRPRR